MMKTHSVVIVRHGESEFNCLNLFCGWHDAPLSENGAAEARTVAANNLIKAKMEFDMVYTSMLSRAQHTADIILSAMNCAYVPIKTDWRLNERHYGNLTGYNKKQMQDKYGVEQLQSWRRGYQSLPPPIDPENRYYYGICNNPSLGEVPPEQFPATESMHMCAERVIRAWNEIKTEVMEGKRILICAHGTVARSLVMHIEGLTAEAIKKVNIPNCVPIVYEFDGKSGERVGPATYLGDPEYIKEKTAQVASIGKG